MAVCCLLALAAHADGSVSGLVSIGTDYVFRGVSQTYGGATLQGAVNYRHPSGWFAGVWASNVDPYPFDASFAETNVYVGKGWSLSPSWTANATYTRYQYVFDHRRKPYDYGEIALSLAFEDRLTATVSYQPDSTRYSTEGYVRNRPSAAYELAGRWPVAKGLSVVAGAGYYDLTRLYGVGYWSGNTGVSYSVGRYELDVVRFYADRTVRRLFDEASADRRWVATATVRF